MFLEIPKLAKRKPLERVAFFGPMVSGKTFFAQHLVNTYGYEKVALADKLKSIVYDLYGISGKDGQVRKILQEFGDAVKQFDEEVFIKHFLLKVRYLESRDRNYPSLIVCDDLRFVREAEIMREAGFALIRIECSDEIREQRLARLYPNTDTSLHAHRSEQQFLDIEPDHTFVSETYTDLKGLEALFRGGH